MDHHFDYLQYLVEKGGPEAEDYHDFDTWLAEVAEHARKGELTPTDLGFLREVMGEAISAETMQGFVYQKPHGYAGDYEVIDRIYKRYVSDKSHLSRWDAYAQEHVCSYAVRNRVEYFANCLGNSLTRNVRARVQVLNLASGPGRDMLRFFERYPDAPVHIDCIEQDRNAVNHASALCEAHLDKIIFHVRNALRFQTGKKYDLIWSAGLFDYFDDNVFVFMLKKLGMMIAEDGEIVIGNFSSTNPSRPYMELFEWHLHHRSPVTLRALAARAGFAPEKVRVGKEETGVNLFLHVKPAGISR